MDAELSYRPLQVVEAAQPQQAEGKWHIHEQWWVNTSSSFISYSLTFNNMPVWSYITTKGVVDPQIPHLPSTITLEAQWNNS